MAAHLDVLELLVLVQVVDGLVEAVRGGPLVQVLRSGKIQKIK